MSSTPLLPPADPHLSIGAHALHALPADEAGVFDAHLADCQTCMDELGGLRAAAAMLGAAEARRPPAALREQVLAAAAGTAQDPPLTPVVRLGSRRPRRNAPSQADSWYRRPAGWLVAAAAVLVIGGGITWSVLSGQQATPTATMQQCVTEDQSAATVIPTVGDGGSLVRSDSCKAVLVNLPKMPTPPAGKAYQLWMIKGTTPISAGLVPSLDGAVVPLSMSAGDVTVAVTVEPAAGSEQPTGKPIWAVPLR